MPNVTASPTPITPPRVPLIDPRTGLIERSWYMFFLSLFKIAQGFEEPSIVPNTASLVASYDAALQILANDARTRPAQEQLTQAELFLPPTQAPQVPQTQVDNFVLPVPVTMPDNNGTVASATTLDLTQVTSSTLDVTGTTGISAIRIPEGQTRTVRFTGILILTHSASLVLPGAVDITTASGDFAIFRGYALGVVRCVTYSFASSALLLLPGTAALPSLARRGDINTGLFFPADDKLGFSAGGLERLRIDAGGVNLLERSKLFLDGVDGTGDTYLVESGVNVVDLYVGGVKALSLGVLGSAVAGHVTLEGVTSTGATGIGKLVFDNSPTLITPNLGGYNGTKTPVASITVVNGVVTNVT